MKNSSFFQTFLLIAFGIALLVGVLIFSGILPGFRAKTVGEVGRITLWGTVPIDQVSRFIETLNKEGESQFVVTYIQKNIETVDAELLEALASDNPPDMVLLPQEIIFQYRDKIYPVPFTSLTKRQFSDTFVDGANIFETTDGYLALPVGVDPLVLFYNKDLYTNANIVTPPVSWEEFLFNQSKLTALDNTNRVNQSAVAMGTSNNIYNFKNIFSLLSMQAGSKPIIFDGVNLYANLFSNIGGALNPVQLALDFYNQFSNPQRSTYSWNRSLPLDRDYFLAGKLANYFGYSNEIAYFVEKNPHLNLDVVAVPRLNKNTNLTLGRFYGLAIMKKTTKVSASFAAAFSIIFTERDTSFSKMLNIAPVKRIIVKQGDPNPFRQIFLNEALVSQAWADPAPTKTKEIFSRMIDNSTTGRLSGYEAVNKANDELKLLLNNK